MKAMILAAGEGTRMRPLTIEWPKPMLPIQGKPILEYTIELLRHHGITQIAVNLHHRPAVITEYFGDGRDLGVEITYSFEDQLLGTAGAVKKLEHYFDDTFLVFYGDVLTNLNLSALVDFHRTKAGIATIALYRVENPSACGIVELDKGCRIIRFVEKPPPQAVFSDLANSGILVLERAVIDHIPAGVFRDFGYHVLPDLLTKGHPMYGYPIPDTFYLIDIGTMEKYERAQREWPKVHAKRRRQG